jgi:hypothetical protein
MSVMTTAALCTVIVLGTASAGLAVGSPAIPAETQKCIASTRAPAHGFGYADAESMGLAGHAEMVARCLDDYYQVYRRLPQ